MSEEMPTCETCTTHRGCKMRGRCLQQEEGVPYAKVMEEKAPAAAAAAVKQAEDFGFLKDQAARLSVQHCSAEVRDLALIVLLLANKVEEMQCGEAGS